LLDALSKTRPGIANREVSDQSSFFYFAQDYIWTDNDELSICQKFKSNIGGGIKAQEFYDLISKLPFEHIFIEQQDETIFITDEATFKAQIKIIEPKKEQAIKPPAKNSKQWSKLPDEFTKAATFCTFTAGKNMQKPALTCVWFTNDDDGAVAISCDGFRGTTYYFGENDKFEKPFLIPASCAKHMALYNPVRYILTDSWVHFMNNEDTVLSCRILATEYPEEIWQFFTVEGLEIKLPDNFTSTVERASTIVSTEFEVDKTVKLILSDGKIKCKGEGPLGWIEEEKDIEYKGEKIEILVHPRLLLDILKYQSAMTLGERLLFETDDFVHVVVLSESE